MGCTQLIALPPEGFLVLYTYAIPHSTELYIYRPISRERPPYLPPCYVFPLPRIGSSSESAPRSSTAVQPGRTQDLHCKRPHSIAPVSPSIGGRRSQLRRVYDHFEGISRDEGSRTRLHGGRMRAAHPGLQVKSVSAPTAQQSTHRRGPCMHRASYISTAFDTVWRCH